LSLDEAFAISGKYLNENSFVFRGKEN